MHRDCVEESRGQPLEQAGEEAPDLGEATVGGVVRDQDGLVGVSPA
jgi:hypothetical protein